MAFYVRGRLGTPDNGVVGENTSGSGSGVYGIFADSGTGTGYGTSGTCFSTSPDAAGVFAQGNGSNGPGLPAAAALRVNTGAIVAAGPLPERFSGTEIVGPAGWISITSCPGGGPAHTHVIGFYIDVPLANNLIMGGPPNVGSMIHATVESVPMPEPQTSYYAQVHSKVPGGCMIRVTRMGIPGACTLPTVPNYVHWTIINPDGL